MQSQVVLIVPARRTSNSSCTSASDVDTHLGNVPHSVDAELHPFNHRQTIRQPGNKPPTNQPTPCNRATTRQGTNQTTNQTSKQPTRQHTGNSTKQRAVHHTHQPTIPATNTQQPTNPPPAHHALTNRLSYHTLANTIPWMSNIA